MLPIHHTRVHVFNYDEIPAGYYYRCMEEGHPVQRFWHREKFRQVATRIPAGARVLDVGCGPGSFLSVLVQDKPGVRAIGADIASSQIDFARQHVLPAHPGRDLSFVTLDPHAERLPFPDASFDVVTSIEVIEHLHPFVAIALLNEARRVLTPEGRLIVTTPNYRSLWPLIEFALERRSPVKYHEQHISKFTPNALVKFLECAGFDALDLRSFFVVAPFLAGLSGALARTVQRLETRGDFLLGSLLLAEARVNRDIA